MDVTARVIGSAAVRLEVDGTGLSSSIKREITRAIKETAASHPFTDIEKEADTSAKKTGKLFSNLGDGAQSLGQKLGSAVSIGSRIAAIGAAAGTAVAGVSSLVNGVLQLLGVLVNVSGVAALLPAAFLALGAVIATVKIGVSGVSDAFKALASGDAAKLNEALKKLAPSAREFVLSAKAIKPAFDAMKLDVQQNLFRGLGVQLQLIAAAQLPGVRAGLSGIASELNLTAVGVGHFLTNAVSVGQVATIFQNIRAAVAAAGPSVNSLLDALLNVGSVGASFLPGLADGFSSVASTFADFIARVTDSGQLAQFIQTGIDTLKQLGAIAGNVLGIIGDLMNAGTGSGGGLLNNLILITGQIREFTSSAAGSQAINTLFESLHAVIQALLPIVLNVAGIFATTLAPILANLATTVLPALNPVIGILGEALKTAAPGVAALGAGFAALITGLGPALPAIGQLAAVLGQGLGQVMAALGPVLGQLVSVLAGQLAKAIPPLIPIITQLVTMFGNILIAVAPLIAPLVELVVAALTPVLAIIEALIPPFTQLVQSVLLAIQPLIPVIAAAFTQLGQALAPLAGALGAAIVQIFTALLPAIGPLVNAIVALVVAILPLIPPLVTLIQILAPIIALIVQLAATIIGFVVGALQPLIAAFGVANTVIGGVMNFVLTIISGVVSTVTAIFSGFLTVVSNVWGSVTSAISGAVNKVRDFISSGFNAAVGFVRTAFTNIVNAVSTGVSNAVSFVSGLPGKILGAIGNFATLLFNAGADLLRGLVNGIGSMIQGVINKVKDIGTSILKGIKGALGISSPSREMAKIGVFVGEGLIVGLAKITPSVLTAAGSLGDSVLSAVQTPVGSIAIPGSASDASGNGVVSGNVLNQTNVMLPGTDVQQFAASVLSRANQDFLSGASTLAVSRQGVQNGITNNILTGVAM